mgnify:CR=1 FL=1
MISISSGLLTAFTAFFQATEPLAADVLQSKGATSVMACCTHGVLSGPAFNRIEKSALDELVITDTIPLSRVHDKITVLTASEITAKTIKRIYTNESIQSIFI